VAFWVDNINSEVTQRINLYRGKFTNKNVRITDEVSDWTLFISVLEEQPPKHFAEMVKLKTDWTTCMDTLKYGNRDALPVLQVDSDENECHKELQ
jgi:hypothetical protein